MTDVYLRTLAFFLLGHLILKSAKGTGLYMGPYFPTPQTRNITVHQNAAAYLPCAVKQLGDKSVSWVRQRDADILTVDRYTFVRDERLTVHYVPSTETWTLVIKYVQERDAGTYECQISTEPKMSMWVHLNVIVPRVEIIGEVDKYVRKGSTTRLECMVSSTVQLPDYIFWYHSGERLLEYDNPRVKFSVSRRGGQGSEMSITSLLIMGNTQPEDEGNYTCLPSNLHPATTNLHVLNDEHPAAMQTGAAMLTDPPSTWGMMMVVVIAFIFVQAHQNFNLSTNAPGHNFVVARKLTRSESTPPHTTAISGSQKTTGGSEQNATEGKFMSKDPAIIVGTFRAELTTLNFRRSGCLLPLCRVMFKDGKKNRKKSQETESFFHVQFLSSKTITSKLSSDFSEDFHLEKPWRKSNQYNSCSFTEMNYFDPGGMSVFEYDPVCNRGYPPKSLPSFKVSNSISY